MAQAPPRQRALCKLAPLVKLSCTDSTTYKLDWLPRATESTFVDRTAVETAFSQRFTSLGPAKEPWCS